MFQTAVILLCLFAISNAAVWNICVVDCLTSCTCLSFFSECDPSKGPYGMCVLTGKGIGVIAGAGIFLVICVILFFVCCCCCCGLCCFRGRNSDVVVITNTSDYQPVNSYAGGYQPINATVY